MVEVKRLAVLKRRRSRTQQAVALLPWGGGECPEVVAGCCHSKSRSRGSSCTCAARVRAIGLLVRREELWLMSSVRYVEFAVDLAAKGRLVVVA